MKTEDGIRIILYNRVSQLVVVVLCLFLLSVLDLGLALYVGLFYLLFLLRLVRAADVDLDLLHWSVAPQAEADLEQAL